MLRENESVVYQGRPSWLYYYNLYFLGLIPFLFLSKERLQLAGVFACFFIGLAIFFRFRYKFIITNERIIMRVGLIAKNLNEMELKHIRNIQIRQGLIERLINIGSLAAVSVADGEAAVTFRGLRNPVMVRKFLDTGR